MSYERVLPRDLFNESKLLKCLGLLCMRIHDEMCNWTVEHRTDEYNQGFEICRDDSDGSIYVQNLYFKTKGGVFVPVSTPLNSKLDWPLQFQWLSVDYPLFTDRGEFTEEYRKFTQ